MGARRRVRESNRFPNVRGGAIDRHYGDDNIIETSCPAFVSVELSTSQVASDKFTETGQHTPPPLLLTHHTRRRYVDSYPRRLSGLDAVVFFRSDVAFLRVGPFVSLVLSSPFGFSGVGCFATQLARPVLPACCHAVHQGRRDVPDDHVARSAPKQLRAWPSAGRECQSGPTDAGPLEGVARRDGADGSAVAHRHRPTSPCSNSGGIELDV